VEVVEEEVEHVDEQQVEVVVEAEVVVEEIEF
jgi:hypothetical protein